MKRIISLVFVTLMASQISFWSSGQRFLQQQSEAQYTDQAELIRDVFEQTDFAGTADYDAFAKKYARRQEVRITIIDMDGTVLGESEESPSDMENHKDREEVKKAMAGESASIVRRSSTLGMDYCYCAVPVRTDSFEGVLRVSVPLEELHAQPVLQVLNVAAQGGLGDEQGLGGFGNVAFFGDGDDVG